MASQQFRLMDARTLGPNESSDSSTILYLGAYSVLVLDPRVLKTGSAGSVIIETSATKEPGTWRDVHTFPVNNAAAMTTVATFLRYVRWRTSSDVAGSPNVVIDGVAKGG